LPAAVITELEKCTPTEESIQTTWANTSAFIKKLITIKNQTLKAFNE
jgi:hypothetical protein